MTSLRREIVVRCPPHHAFAVFTEQVAKWWPRSHLRHPEAGIRFEPHVGGRLLEEPPDGPARVLGEVLQWSPPDRLAYTWRPGAPDGLSTRVEITFVADAGATRVRVEHRPGRSGWDADWLQRAEKFTGPWSHVLGAFATFIEESS